MTRVVLEVGDEVEVYGQVFTLVEMTQKVNEPPRLKFLSPVEMMEEKNE